MLDRGKVHEVYTEAAGLPVAQRAAFVEHACAGDEALRAEVESLLAAAASRPAFMASPTTGGSGSGATEAPGTQIGPYRLLEEIGHGGFGSVFMAEQEAPVRRRVALKIIKLGMDTRAVIARFEAERQALAMMDHAHIAKVLDAGTTSSGRPFFVMELVKGEAITTYADRASLSIDERLDLFVQVCQAVQHAHSKGVIHRDIKPGNVLVATQDGRPHAKVIDFGIAKATDHRLTERTLFTEFHQLVGTPEYMSPEQAGGAADVDTRSDVYSLGVLLYELLTGATPFDAKELRSAAYAEIQRIIREVEPPKPSTRLSSLETLATVAALRHTEPARLSAMVTGDLDWIVMKALEKDRARRYETPSALAADIQRHLAGEPVDAAPPSAAYRARKFVRRNSALVGASAAVGIVLILGVVGTSIGLMQANRARANEVEQRAAAQTSARIAGEEAARAARAEAGAKARAAELERVAAFQEVQLGTVDASLMGGRLRADLLAMTRAAGERSRQPPAEVSGRIRELETLISGADFTGIARNALDQNIFRPAIVAIKRQFGEEPLVMARLLQAVASAMRELGLLQGAAGPQEDALEIRRRVLGPDHADTLASMDAKADLLHARGRVPEAEALLRTTLDGRRRVLGENAGTYKTMERLGVVLASQQKLVEAESHSRDALNGLRVSLGDDHPDTLEAMNSMGYLLWSQGKRHEAESMFRDALGRMGRVLGEDNPVTLGAMHNLGFVLLTQGKYEEADGFLRGALERRRRVLGDQHPDTLISLINMGLLLQAEGDMDGAESNFREALESSRLVLGPDHDTSVVAINHLRGLLHARGKLAEAEPYFRAELDRCRRVEGEGALRTLIVVSETGALLREQGKAAETVVLLVPSEEAARRVFTDRYVLSLARFLGLLGRARVAVGDLAGGEANLVEAHAIVSGSERKNRDVESAVLTGMVELHTARHIADPSGGHDDRAREWRERLKALEATPIPGKP